MTKTKTPSKTKTVSKPKGQDKFNKDLKKVQDHYLDYPYPMRNPDDDKTRLMRMQGDFLGDISHTIYKGKKDFNGFRVLVAGGGTGDSTVWLAAQLMDYKDTEVVYLDFSKASMDIAQKRAAHHGITNITWIEDSILNIPDLNLGKFDFINCIGVLHHLENPDLGLKILSDSLKEDGGAHIMVYAQYGRTGVYQVQELLRYTNEGIEDRKKEVESAWDVVNALPVTNWFRRGEDLISDHKMYGDIGLYDLFLHKQDRAYTIPQLYEFVEKAGMNIASYVDPYMRAVLNIDSYLPKGPTKDRINKMSPMQREAICELMAGNIIKHTIHIAKKKKTNADFEDFNNVPFLFYSQSVANEICNFIEQNEQTIMNKSVQYTYTDSMNRQMNVNLAVLPHTKYLFKHLNGENSFQDIFNAVRKETKTKASDQELWNEFYMNLKGLFTIGAVLLRHKSIPKFNMFDNK